MARSLKTVITNFSAGELNPLLATRTDTPAYINGAKQCRNFSLLAEGGVMRRPGSTYLASLPGESRLIPFIFSDDEIAIIALSNNRMDVYNISGTAFVGDKDRVFFDVATKTFRLSDGVTPGGIVINAGGGGGGSLTGITDSTTGPVMVLTDVNVNIENSLTIESDQAINPVENTQYILYGTTTNANEIELYRDSNNSQVPLANQSTVFFEVEVVGRQNFQSETCAFQFKGIIDYNQAGNVQFVGGNKEIVSAGSNEDYDARVIPDNTNKSIKILVTGDSQYEMAWVARVKLTQVTHT